MESLQDYADKFDENFPDYTDERYLKIGEMLERYNVKNIDKLLAKKSFQESVALIQPLVAIKNYKSQVPFPEDISAALKAIVEVRKADICKEDRFKNLVDPFNQLVETQGFQLPTISAMFHFCHPQHFPIVDINVAAACKKIKKDNKSEFEELKKIEGFKYPNLPGQGTSKENKLNKYKNFIYFIDHILKIHPKSWITEDYRSMDKALMVLGSKYLEKEKKKGNLIKKMGNAQKREDN